MTTVALDIRFRAMSGSSIALANLARHLVELAPPEIRLLAVRYRDQKLPPELAALDAIIVPGMRVPAELIWNEMRLPGLLRRAGVDLFHAMKQCAPFRLRCPSVHTVDAIKRGTAEELPMALIPRLYWGWHACSSYKRSTHLLPVSNYVSEFLITQLGIGPDRITVVHNGVNELFLNTDEQADGSDAGDLSVHEVPLIICVGSVIPLKNQLAVVRALARIADRVPHHVALLGRADPAYARQVRQAAEVGGITDRLHMIGFLGVKGLLAYMRRAEVMAHVSRTEGFCLATAEAMACGLPLVLTDRGALREQCDDAALYIDDPDDHEGLARVLLQVLTDPALRQTMSRRGTLRAQSLTWSEAARKTLEVYSRLLGVG